MPSTACNKSFMQMCSAIIKNQILSQLRVLLEDEKQTLKNLASLTLHSQSKLESFQTVRTICYSWLVVQNLKIARSRGFIFPEAFRLTLVKGIVRIKNVELRPFIKARREKREVVSDWTKSVDQSKTETLVRDSQREDKLLLPAQGWLRNFDVSGF